MKVLFFWMNGCPHCIKIKEELKKVSESKKFISIEKANVTDIHKSKYGVKSYPTIIYLTDDNRMIKKSVGFDTAEDISLDYRSCNRLDKLFKRTGKLY